MTIKPKIDIVLTKKLVSYMSKQPLLTFMYMNGWALLDTEEFGGLIIADYLQRINKRLDNRMIKESVIDAIKNFKITKRSSHPKAKSEYILKAISKALPYLPRTTYALPLGVLAKKYIEEVFEIDVDEDLLKTYQDDFIDMVSLNLNKNMTYQRRQKKLDYQEIARRAEKRRKSQRDYQQRKKKERTKALSIRKMKSDVSSISLYQWAEKYEKEHGGTSILEDLRDIIFQYYENKTGFNITIVLCTLFELEYGKDKRELQYGTTWSENKHYIGDIATDKETPLIIIKAPQYFTKSFSYIRGGTHVLGGAILKTKYSLIMNPLRFRTDDFNAYLDKLTTKCKDDEPCVDFLIQIRAMLEDTDFYEYF